MIRSFLPYQKKIFKGVFYEFYYRKNYLETQPINGYTSYTSSIIIELFIEKNTNLLKDFRLKFIIDNTIKFKHYIDFQYLSNHNFPLIEDSQLHCKNIFKSCFNIEMKKAYQIIPIDIIPNFFSRYIEKNNKKKILLNYGNFFYIFKKFINEKFSIPFIELDKRSFIDVKNQNYCLIDFLNDCIPNLPHKKIKNRLFRIPLFAIGYLSLFLKRRPLWTRRVLDNYIPISLKKFIKKALPSYCYRFKGCNPYKRTWIRYGYDPRKINKTFIYQTFIISKIYHKYDKNITLYKKNMNKNNHKTNRFYQQICDFENQLIKHLVKKKNINQKKIYINSITGWLEISEYIELKKKLKKIAITYDKG